MGYTMFQSAGRFFLPATSKMAAFRALRTQRSDLRGRTFEEIFDAFWSTTADPETGDITAIQFNREKFGWGEEEYLETVAPFVRCGSYVEMVGEDGDTWRWVFDGQTVTRVAPQVIWPALPTDSNGKED